MNSTLQYIKPPTPGHQKIAHIDQNIIWFNAPCSMYMSTNFTKRFPVLTDHRFPKTNKLIKMFNRSTIKVSYCCTQNFFGIIKCHNRKIAEENIDEILPCYRRNKQYWALGKVNVT